MSGPKIAYIDPINLFGRYEPNTPPKLSTEQQRQYDALTARAKALLTNLRHDNQFSARMHKSLEHLPQDTRLVISYTPIDVESGAQGSHLKDLTDRLAAVFGEYGSKLKKLKINHPQTKVLAYTTAVTGFLRSDPKIQTALHDLCGVDWCYPMTTRYPADEFGLKNLIVGHFYGTGIYRQNVSEPGSQLKLKGLEEATVKAKFVNGPGFLMPWRQYRISEKPKPEEPLTLNF